MVILHSEIYPKETHRDVDKDSCAMILMAKLLVIVANWKQLEITNSREHVK